jgi:hypothetical protein
MADGAQLCPVPVHVPVPEQSRVAAPAKSGTGSGTFLETFALADASRSALAHRLHADQPSMQHEGEQRPGDEP